MKEEELRSVLHEAGFTEGESAMYLALLRVGESKVGPLIKVSGISRSKVYDILERLIIKKVASKIEKNNILYYQALSPHTIVNFIKEKERKLKTEEEKLREIIPQLNSLLPKQDMNIKVYEGIEGFKTMIERTINELTKNDIYRAWGISKTTEAMRRYALKIYQIQKEKKFKARSIFDKEGVYKIEERKNKLHEIRILPKEFHTPTLFTLYKDTVGIHTGNEETIVSIVIKNKDIAESFAVTFEAMWKISKKI